MIEIMLCLACTSTLDKSVQPTKSVQPLQKRELRTMALHESTSVRAVTRAHMTADPGEKELRDNLTCWANGVGKGQEISSKMAGKKASKATMALAAGHCASQRCGRCAEDASADPARYRTPSERFLGLTSIGKCSSPAAPQPALRAVDPALPPDPMSPLTCAARWEQLPACRGLLGLVENV